MIVTPAPIGLLIVLIQPGEIAVLTMVLLVVHAVRPVFVAIPLMIVVVFFVMVSFRRFGA